MRRGLAERKRADRIDQVDRSEIGWGKGGLIERPRRRVLVLRRVGLVRVRHRIGLGWHATWAQGWKSFAAAGPTPGGESPNPRGRFPPSPEACVIAWENLLSQPVRRRGVPAAAQFARSCGKALPPATRQRDSVAWRCPNATISRERSPPHDAELKGFVRWGEPRKHASVSGVGGTASVPFAARRTGRPPTAATGGVTRPTHSARGVLRRSRHAASLCAALCCFVLLCVALRCFSPLCVSWRRQPFPGTDADGRPGATQFRFGRPWSVVALPAVLPGAATPFPASLHPTRDSRWPLPTPMSRTDAPPADAGRRSCGCCSSVAVAHSRPRCGGRFARRISRTRSGSRPTPLLHCGGSEPPLSSRLSCCSHRIFSQPTAQ